MSDPKNDRHLRPARRKSILAMIMALISTLSWTGFELPVRRFRALPLKPGLEYCPRQCEGTVRGLCLGGFVSLPAVALSERGEFHHHSLC